MALINLASLFDWKDGDIITADKYKQEREMLVAAINDNNTLSLDRYTKKQTEDLLAGLAGVGRTNETIIGNRTSILDIYNTKYTKIEVDNFLKDKQTQIDQNKVDVTILYRDKLYTIGDFKGTWNGISLGQAAEPINGGRLDVLEPSFAKVKADMYDIANATIEITHNLNDTPLVQVVGELGFGYSGFGIYGFGGSKIAYPNRVEYVNNNVVEIYLDEPLGVPVIAQINTRLYSATYDTGIVLTIKLI